ncbi:MAG: hypothetical protein JOS17DRAFT_754513 [Linnemannia elongata]|nr:MAG: hypothetical protein JOS17DRAFT_754513 [Linnemannia elongata]
MPTIGNIIPLLSFFVSRTTAIVSFCFYARPSSLSPQPLPSLSILIFYQPPDLFSSLLSALFLVHSIQRFIPGPLSSTEQEYIDERPLKKPL